MIIGEDMEDWDIEFEEDWLAASDDSSWYMDDAYAWFRLFCRHRLWVSSNRVGDIMERNKVVIRSLTDRYKPMVQTNKRWGGGNGSDVYICNSLYGKYILKISKNMPGHNNFLGSRTNVIEKHKLFDGPSSPEGSRIEISVEERVAPIYVTKSEEGMDKSFAFSILYDPLKIIVSQITMDTLKLRDDLFTACHYRKRSFRDELESRGVSYSAFISGDGSLPWQTYLRNFYRAGEYTSFVGLVEHIYGSAEKYGMDPNKDLADDWSYKFLYDIFILTLGGQEDLHPANMGLDRRGYLVFFDY
jgi:hypothetical protein